MQVGHGQGLGAPWISSETELGCRQTEKAWAEGWEGGSGEQLETKQESDGHSLKCSHSAMSWEDPA